MKETEFGELIQNINWSATSLKAPELWPESLKTAASIALSSGFPMAIYWSEDFTLLYNEAWSNILGQKHPWALGKPGAVVGTEIWDGLKQEFESVLSKGQLYRRTDLPLYIYRNGYTEESYFNYSLSPIMEADGTVAGVLNTLVETSYRIINERRNAIRDDFIAQTHTHNTLTAAYEKINNLLSNAFMDISFFALYSLDTNNDLRSVVFNESLTERQLRDLASLLKAQDFEGIIHLKELHKLLAEPINGHWPEMVTEALALPINSAETGLKGYLLLGPSARKHIDEDYRQFFLAIAANTSTIIKNAFAAELSFAYQEELVLNAALFEKQQTIRLHAEATERRYQFMLNAIPQQVWTALPNGELNYINQVVADDFGHPIDEIIGQGWQAFIHPDDLPSCLLTWEHALATGNEYLTEFRLKFANNGYVWHLSRAVPLIENGEITLWLGTSTNIETKKQNEQRKDEFLSIASHELKTPLTGIKAFTQLMKRSTDLERTASYIEKSSENINRLERLINDLLDVTKINAGKLTYELQPFDFSQMLKDSVENVQLTSGTHQISLEQPEQIHITGDRLRLEQVIHNFLNNAIKYSPGESQVIVKSQVSGNWLIVSVQDFGIGIQEQHIKRLFDRYYRIDNTAMRFEGLGLGLFISSEILKRHRSNFWIESKPGIGSTFYFRLPIKETSDEKPIANDDQFYQDSQITIIQNNNKDCLEVDWKGFQTLEAVKKGGMRMFSMLKTNGLHKILNDNTNVMGTWSEASDWAGKEWFPMMEKAGLKYLAWVYSPSAFSRLSAEKAVDVKVGNTVVQFFTDVESARNWLNGKTD